jgi:LPXTG-motif cell wall-anchored protein
LEILLRVSLRTIGTGALGAVAALLILGTTPAGASPTDPPQSGDDRATVYPGNIKDGDCAIAGLAGSAIEVGATIEDATFITITSVPSGYTLTGVVVKGSDAYNVYAAAHTTGLHAPLAGQSGAPAQISHWFACGTTTVPTSSTTSTTTSSTTSSTSTSSTTSTAPTSPSTTTSGATSSTDAPSSTPTPSTTRVSPAAEDDDLASTGASVIGYGAAALVLLGTGGGLLYLNRRRATS